MFPAYHLNRRWAWGKRGRSRLRGEVLPYLAMSSLGTTFSLVGATYARHVVHSHHWAHLINTAIVGGTNIAAFAIFWVLKMLLFNRIFHPGTRPRRLDGRKHSVRASARTRTGQSRKLVNCSGTSRSASLKKAIAVCRSSRCLPVTRT